MVNRQHNGRRKHVKWRYLVMMALICIGTIAGFLGDSSHAADVSIKWNGMVLDPGSVYECKTSSMQLELETGDVVYADPNEYKVVWSIQDDQQDGVIATVQSGAIQTTGIFRALSPGEVTVTVTVYNNVAGGGLGALLASATCNIRVVFSVDTSTDDSIYKKVNEEDTDRSLVMYADDAPVNLTLNFGDATNTQWTSNNTEVVTVEQRTGRVTPVGAGKTQVIATYTPATEGGNTYTAYLDVYIIPKVSLTNGENYVTSLNAQMNSGGYLYTDTDFRNSLEVVRSKIIWVIKKEDGNGNSVVIANSIGMESDLITLTPTASRSNELRVEGLAGEYDIFFYTYGSYFSEDNCTDAYTPSVVHLTIMSDIGNKEEILHIGDSYNFAEAFNMTTEDFLSAFNVSVTMYGGGDARNYASYNPATGLLEALAEGKVSARVEIKSDMRDYVSRIMGVPLDDLPSSFTVTIDILDRFYLDRSHLTISHDQTHQLSLVLSSTYSGEVVWSSSDSSYVTVDQTGLIKGVRVTQNDVTITATLYVNGGVYRTATCTVKVEESVTGFTIDPNTSQTMLPGEHLTVVANIKQTVSVAPLMWLSSNESVFTVETASDGKSAVVTAVAGGSAVLTVLNPLITGQQQTLEIVVQVPINGISMPEAVSVGLYKGGYNMKDEVKTTPANATHTTLTWASSDTSVATVDKDGYITFNSPGQTLINVYPTYNPYNVMASCILTVIGTPNKMTLSETDVTLNVGESKILEMNFEPKNTLTELTFTPNEEGIVKTDYDGERKFLTLVGQNPGSTNINIVSKEGLILNLRVTVKQPATEVQIQPRSLTVLTDSTEQLEAKLTPANSTDTIVWRSYNTAIATVDVAGKVRGIKAGTTFIEARAYNGSVNTTLDVIQVTVLDGIKGITQDAVRKTVYVGASITLVPIFTPESAYNKEMKWTVDDAGIAKVEASSISNAKVTGVKVGTTMVTGESVEGGHKISYLIDVIAPPVDNDTKVTLSPTTKYIAPGKSFYITATVTGTSNKKVKWKTSKKKVATVDSSGKVKAKKLGTAYITATAQDGSGASARCKVRVVRKVTKIKLNKYSATLLVGNSLKLKATVKPKNASIKSVSWSSSKKSIATVSSSGRVIGVSEGIVKIKAKAKDGSGKSATCIVKVSEPIEATGIDVANSEITVAKGKTAQSGITLNPINSTTKIKYHSDNPRVATVNKYGKITTKRAGEATIYGTTSTGLIGYCDVLVVDLDRKAVTLRQYDTEQLVVNEISEGVTWYSKDINIATVSPNGLVTGRRKGTTTVYAVVNNVKLGCRVTVRKIK